MTRQIETAVMDLFTLLGSDRQTDRAKLYAERISATVGCTECAVLALRRAGTHARRMPPVGELVSDARALAESDEHTAHIIAPQLPGAGETFWHQTGTKLLRPHVETDDEALFLAAEMWFLGLPADPELISEIAADPKRLGIWKARMLNRPVTGERVALAFQRARKNAEKPVATWSDSEWAELAEA